MDLTTTYLGLTLDHPIVPSASPLSEDLDSIRRLEDAGAAAVVLFSLFEEQLEGESHMLDRYLSYGSDSFFETLNYFPEMDTYGLGSTDYLDLIRQAKEAVDIPIIGSLNGSSPGGWTTYAKRIEEAGADALELNIYYVPTNPLVKSAAVEQMYLDIVKSVKQSISIPIAVKVGPFFSAFANMAQRLDLQGADALVLFNRFYQPELDLTTMEVSPNLVLSTSDDLRLPLRWIALLYGQVSADLAITSGVHTYEDVAKGVLAGANVTMMTSELLQNGPGRMLEICSRLAEWMEAHEFESIKQMRGAMSQRKVAVPDAFERANYMKILKSWQSDEENG